MAGRILPARDGYVYLTDVLYRLGWQATDRLALPEKIAEVAIPIPMRNTVETGRLAYLGIVPEWPASTGYSFRRGGGHQWVVSSPIDLPVYPWSWIALEVP